MIDAAALQELQSRLVKMEQRLQQAEDRDAIQRLFIDLQKATDAHDAERYAECFTPDGEWSGVSGRAVGRAAIAEHMRRSWSPWDSETERTYHSVGDFSIDLNGDAATAEAQFWHIRLDKDGHPEGFHFGRFEGDLQRTPAGWRFKRRAGYLLLPYHEPRFQLAGAGPAGA